MDKIYEKLFGLNHQLYSYWRDHLLFEPQWWLSLGLLIIPWIIVGFYILKKGAARYVISPILFCILFAVFTDYLGVSYGFWFYKVKLIPLTIDIPWDFTLLPTSVTFLLLIKPQMNPIIKAFILTILTSFIAEPFFNFIHHYEYLTWKYIYSFPIYFTIYLISYKLNEIHKFEPLSPKGSKK